MYFTTPDGFPNQFYQAYAVITGPGFSVQSSTITIGKEGTPVNVDVFVKKEDGTDLSGGYMKHYTNPNWRNLQVPDVSTVWLTLDSYETLWTETDVVSNPTEKYHHWKDDETDILNYQSFFVDPTTDNLTSWLKSVNNATLQAKLLSVNQIKGNIGFKDPWLPDGQVLGGIPQNQGTNAVWHTHPSPLIIEPTTDNLYQGVFQNQDPLLNLPYYSIRIKADTIISFHNQNITWYFDGWQTSGAEITQPDNFINGYYKSPVVFRQNNAMVTAQYKGHLAGNSVTATAYNNGRRVVQTNDGTWHLVYSDANNIYYTTSTDNGQSWSKEEKVNLATGKNTSPSITTNGVTVAVVWDHDYSFGHQPILRVKISPGLWGPEVPPPATDVNSANTTPAILYGYHAGVPSYYIISRMTSDSSQVGLWLFKYAEALAPGETLIPVKWVTNSGKTAVYPSAINEYPGAPTLHLVWEDHNRIYYSYFDGVSFNTTPEEISSPVWNGENHHPTITFGSDGYINVLWEHIPIPATPEIVLHHRRMLPGNDWEDIQEIKLRYSYLEQPSVGAQQFG